MDAFIITISIVYSLVVIGFSIAFLIFWYRKKEELRPYKQYGFTMGTILIGFEVILLVFLLLQGNAPSFLIIIFTDIFAFFRISAFTIMGIYYCSLLGIPGLPFVMDKLGRPKFDVHNQFDTDPEEPLEEQTPIETDEMVVEETAVIENHPLIASDDIVGGETAVTTPLLPTFELPSTTKKMIIAASMTAAGGILFSTLLFWLTSPQMSDLAKEQLGVAELTLSNLPFTMLLVLNFAFAEEIVFRLGIQNFLSKQFAWHGEKYGWAIIVTAFIWTMGHVGVMDPNWVKMAQIFPFGLALGWLSKKYGAESAIIAHSLFNVILLIPASYLIS